MIIATILAYTFEKQQSNIIRCDIRHNINPAPSIPENTDASRRKAVYIYAGKSLIFWKQINTEIYGWNFIKIYLGNIKFLASMRSDWSHSLLHIDIRDSKVHGANMGPTWVLSAPGGSHVGPMNPAIRDSRLFPSFVYCMMEAPGMGNEHPFPMNWLHPAGVTFIQRSRSATYTFFNDMLSYTDSNLSL